MAPAAKAAHGKLGSESSAAFRVLKMGCDALRPIVVILVLPACATELTGDAGGAIATGFGGGAGGGGTDAGATTTCGGAGAGGGTAGVGTVDAPSGAANPGWRVRSDRNSASGLSVGAMSAAGVREPPDRSSESATIAIAARLLSGGFGRSEDRAASAAARAAAGRDSGAFTGATAGRGASGGVGCHVFGVGAARSA